MTRTAQLVCLVTAAIVTVIALAFQLDGYPLLDPDEGRNAEVAREMAESGDYVVPRLNGLPYVDKPILYFATVALSLKVLGTSELAARLPSLIFTLATLGVVFWFGRRLFGGVGGAVAAIATGSMPLTLAFARTVIFDSALTLFVVTAIVSFFLAVESRASEADADPERESSGWWVAAGWGAIGLGVLTKGPIAIALPLMVAWPYALWRRRGRIVWDPVGVLLFVAVISPWVVAMARRVPDFLEYALVTETFLRLTTDELRRNGPFWYFLAILPAATLPWSLVAAVAWRRKPSEPRRAEPRDPRLVLLVVWIVVPLLFFSMSQSKRPQYVLPLLPPVGLLVAYFWTKGSSRIAGARFAAAFLAVLAAILFMSPAIVGRLLDVDPAIAAAIPDTGVRLAIVSLAAAAGAWFAATRHPALMALILSLPVAAIPFVSTRLMDAIGEDRSAYRIARAVNDAMTGQTEVVAIETYPLSLPFYLRQPLTVATRDASELTSNYLVRNHERWRNSLFSPLRDPDWWVGALMECERPRVFVAASTNTTARQVLAARLPLIAVSGKTAAYGPCLRTDLARSHDRRRVP